MIKIIYIFFFNLIILSNSLKFNIFDNRPNIKKIDKNIIQSLKPATLNYAMEPLSGLVDGYWVSKLNCIEKVGGQGISDQIFNSFFRLFDIFPYILAPEVSILYSQNKTKSIEKLYSSTLTLTLILSFIISILISYNSKLIVKFFIKENNIIFNHAVNYIKIRIIGLPFCLTNSIIFSILKGMFDFNSALNVNIKCQLLNFIFNPIFMNFFGLTGLAIATLLSEIICCINYINILSKKKINYKFTKKLYIFNFKKCSYVQIKNIFHNFLIVVANNKISNIDKLGNDIATHILCLKIFDFGVIFSKGLHSISSIIISKEILYNNDKDSMKRILLFSNIIGLIQFFLFLNLNIFLKFFTNNDNILNKSKKLTIFLSLIGYTNCLQYTLDGIMQGYQKYKYQAIISITSLLLMIYFMMLSKNLSHIWLSYLLISILKIISMIKILIN